MADRQDVFRNYGFFLELQGQRAGWFTKVTGLGMRLEVIEHREGGMPARVQKLPGQLTVNPVRLSEGVTKSEDMWKWLQTAVAGKVLRRNVSIIVLAPDGQTPVTRWNLNDAWISQCEIQAFDARSNDVLIACLTLEGEMLERANTGAAA
jgi:phage tail-like protein